MDNDRQNKEVLARLEDLERELADLSAKQHNTRYLLKTLIKTVDLKLQGRLRDVGFVNNLYYRHDKHLEEFLQKNPTIKEVEKYVDRADAANITRRRAHAERVGAVVRRLLWYFAWAVFRGALTFAKGMRRLMRKVFHS